MIYEQWQEDLEAEEDQSKVLEGVWENWDDIEQMIREQGET